MQECLQLRPVSVDQFNADKQDQLVEPQADDTQDQIDGKLLFPGEVIPAHEDIFHAEQVVDNDRNGKSDHARDQVRDPDKVADGVQSRVNQKTQSTHDAEFQELLYDFFQWSSPVVFFLCMLLSHEPPAVSPDGFHDRREHQGVDRDHHHFLY